MKILVLDFKKPPKNLAGEVINNTPSLGKLLAQAIAHSKVGDVGKLIGWATALDQDLPLSIPLMDSAMLKNFIRDNLSLIILIKAQLLEIIIEAENTDRDYPKKNSSIETM